jgi:prepilin-type N-terminal cleavage/methylation domain-containing protein
MLKLLTRCKRSRGFTLIELLVVVLILAILLAVAIPLYLSSIANSAVQSCRTNMKMVGNVAHAFRTQDATHTFPTTTAQLDTQMTAEGQPVLGSLRGPNNETYTYTGAATSFTVTCGQGALHGTYDSTRGGF